MNLSMTRAAFYALPFREDITTHPLEGQLYRQRSDGNGVVVYKPIFENPHNHNKYQWWRFGVTFQTEHPLLAVIQGVHGREIHRG